MTSAAAAAAANAPPGAVSSVTSPMAWARSAESRSAVPISAIRAASPCGMTCAMSTDS